MHGQQNIKMCKTNWISSGRPIRVKRFTNVRENAGVNLCVEVKVYENIASKY